MWYFRDYVWGLCWKLQLQRGKLKYEERQFVNLFLIMDSGKASVLGVTELKKKRRYFVHSVWVKNIFLREELGQFEELSIYKRKKSVSD